MDPPSSAGGEGLGSLPVFGGDKEGLGKGPGGRPLPPLLRSRPGSGREAGKEKGKEAAAPADPPALLCPGSPPVLQERGLGFLSPAGGDGGPVPGVAVGGSCRSGALGGRGAGPSSAPLKACQTSSRARGSCPPRSSAPVAQGGGAGPHPGHGSAPRAEVGEAFQPRIQPRAPLHSHHSMLLVNVSAPLCTLPSFLSVPLFPTPAQGCPRKHLPYLSSSGEAQG